MSEAQKSITMTADEVAKELKTSASIVKAAILNGTMPVGLVGRNDGSSQDRTIIVRTRYEKWISGELYR